MSTFKTPVGPQPSKVYWRRRLIVGLGLLAVIIVIVLIIVKPGAAAPAGDAGAKDAGDSSAVDESNADAAPDDAASGDEAPTDDEAAAAEPAADGSCSPASITVEAITDATVYAADADPMLSLSLTNTGTAACTLNVGSDVQEYRITSGTELIWSSKDCQTEPVAVEQSLEPGVAVTTTPFAWARTRSDPATCASDLEKVVGAGASYHLSVLVDGIESAASKQFILN